MIAGFVDSDDECSVARKPQAPIAHKRPLPSNGTTGDAESDDEDALRAPAKQKKGSAEAPVAGAAPAEAPSSKAAGKAPAAAEDAVASRDATALSDEGDEDINGYELSKPADPPSIPQPHVDVLRDARDARVGRAANAAKPASTTEYADPMLINNFVGISKRGDRAKWYHCSLESLAHGTLGEPPNLLPFEKVSKTCFADKETSRKAFVMSLFEKDPTRFDRLLQYYTLPFSNTSETREIIVRLPVEVECESPEDRQYFQDEIDGKTPMAYFHLDDKTMKQLLKANVLTIPDTLNCNKSKVVYIDSSFEEWSKNFPTFCKVVNFKPPKGSKPAKPRGKGAAAAAASGTTPASDDEHHADAPTQNGQNGFRQTSLSFGGPSSDGAAPSADTLVTRMQPARADTMVCVKIAPPAGATAAEIHVIYS